MFLCSRNSSFWWRGTLVWHLWIGRARHLGPCAASFAVEVFNVGGWLTHGDLVLDTEVDFLAVVEHRLIPARVRGEWARLRRKELASVSVPASQDTSHVGHAGGGVVSLRRAPLSLLAQYKRFFLLLWSCGSVHAAIGVWSVFAPSGAVWLSGC